ncbi:T9SS type A sorting domain-containing protein [Flavitalea sp. BT771]|uniref:T9SS type A sorting domain-containing protein n=1 Tax=Flavitalea sp. BT771 TaxID=3063329 RepID=UPI0026E4446A|nr:T9SS type A sorting domain-containing protein [Flavitalea sp. BT771]MDO6434730.1 T9SS type A sorting domain-containing protein [Flavitalea sp. BT771]MDV6223630.1 T9SS type A sorting domain-containing protein [Flavitalea sp. BT771]
MKACARIVLLLTLLIAVCHFSNGQSVSGIVNSYYQVTAVNSGANTVTVDNAAGLTVGQRVLIHQAKGAAITATNTSTFGDITALNNAGGYEFNTICTISGNDVRLRDQFVNAYSVAGQVQLVSIPSYSDVVIAGAVTASPWDPATGKGGIVVLEASGTITLNADIDVSGLGFQGGALVNYPTPTYDCSPLDNVTNFFLPMPASGNITGGRKGEGITGYILNAEYGRGKLANGGGGGNNANTGGGGGGNYGAGGIGGKRAGESITSCHGPYPGVGGCSLSSYGYTTGANRIFFGGGGGSGHENNGVGTPGGNGGGIIILSAATIAGGGGRLLASGIASVNPTNNDPYQAEGDGGGGGGGGGAIILNAAAITGAVTAEAKGGRGSDASNRVNDCTGPGGGGGGGLVWTAGTGVPASVTAVVNGGSNGIVSLGNTKVACQGLANGALPGGAGLGKSSYTPPVSAGPTCVVLASSELRYFTADPSGPGIVVSWALYSPAPATDIRSFIIQRSVDQSHFTEVASLPAKEDLILYRYIDAAENMDGDVYYRLVWQHGQGDLTYSQIAAVKRRAPPASFSFRLQPNPVTDRPLLTVMSERDGSAVAKVYNAQGGTLLTFALVLHKGANSIPLSLHTLAPATYFLVVEMEGRRQVGSFIKRGQL